MKPPRCALSAARLLAAGLLLTASAAFAADAPAPPRMKVDPAWPQALPNGWILGQVSGVAVGPDDHVFIVQRPRSLTDEEKAASLTPPRAKCCKPAPPVLEFDPAGNWSPPGAVRARATTGRAASTASPSTPRATSGSGPMASRTARS